MAVQRVISADSHMTEPGDLWASDFPHADSTFPHSLQVIDENFAGVPAEVTRKIVFETANRLYHIGLS